MGAERAAATEQSNVAYCFGPFRLEPESGLLLREGQPVALTPKVFGALVYLAERSRLLVTKDELMRALWSDAIVSEANLTQTIFVLRKALGEGESGQRYIATVPGRGYRFEAEVRRVSGNGHKPIEVLEPDAATAAVPSSPAEPVQPTRERRGFMTAAALALCAIMLAAGASFVWWRAQPRRHSATGRIMLAVLPFQNLTGDPSQEYFSDGLTEEMISLLGMLDPPRLGVIARTSVMHYKSQQVPLDRIGRELGVGYVLEGSVRRDGEHVRITAQLIQTSDQTHLWAREYDREVGGLLSIQSEIAHEVADEIQLTLGNEKPLRSGRSAGLSQQGYASYDLYLEGMFFLNKRTAPDMRRAIAFFRQAVEKDPRNARAWAGLADCYALMGGYTGTRQAEFIPQARTAALQSLAIDDNLAAAHAALALILQNYDWDWQTSEREFRRAIQLNPNDVTAHQWYAEHLMWRGRFDEALAESERARQLDPLSLIVAADNGAILYFSRQYDRAIEKWRSVLEMDPQFPRAGLIRFAYVEKGMFREAMADAEAHRAAEDDSWYWYSRAIILARSGHKAEAHRALDQLLQANRRDALDASIIADAYAGLEDQRQTLAWMERAYGQRSSGLTALKVNPLYDFLRSNPQFQALVRKVGLTG